MSADLDLRRLEIVPLRGSEGVVFLQPLKGDVERAG